MKSVFADNLRKLCDQRPSYASIARDIGISQQHLNHYLTGKHLPRSEIVNKFANYFGVDQSYFFLDSNITDKSPFEGAMLSYIRQAKVKHKMQPAMADGAYPVLFSIPGEKNFLARGAIFVRLVDGYCTFRRIFANRQKGKLRGVHYGSNIGLIYSIDQYVYFSGIDMRNKSEPSLLVYEMPLWAPNLLVGEGSVVSPFRLSTVRSTIDLKNRKSVKTAMSECGIFAARELALRPQVLEHLTLDASERL